MNSRSLKDLSLGPGRRPKDLIFVMGLVILSGVMGLLWTVLLFVGVFHVPEEVEKKAHFLVSSSDYVAGTVEAFTAVACGVAAYGLWRETRWGWWFNVAFCAYNIVSTANIWPQYAKTAVVSLLFSVLILIWLMWRRRLFGIGSSVQGK